jgi:hypothetical protein
MRSRIVFLLPLAFAVALVLAQPSFADTATASAGASSCTNSAPAPVNIEGTLYNSFVCNLYDDASTYSINLTALMVQGGATLNNNLVGPGYLVVINGDPNVISSGDTDDAALYNESLWDTVVYWPGDQDAGTASDTVTVYEAGDFPDASTVQTLDEDLYGSGADSEFFIEQSGFDSVYSTQTSDPANFNVYNIYSAPESGTLSLLAVGLASLGVLVLMRRRAATPVV